MSIRKTSTIKHITYTEKTTKGFDCRLVKSIVVLVLLKLCDMYPNFQVLPIWEKRKMAQNFEPTIGKRRELPGMTKFKQIHCKEW
jgi:hypothetical protein